jgi:hypothetical protein
MATTKKEATGNLVQGHRTIDLRDDVVAIDEVARRLHIPKTTLYGWRYREKVLRVIVSASICAIAGARCSSGSTGWTKTASAGSGLGDRNLSPKMAGRTLLAQIGKESPKRD